MKLGERHLDSAQVLARFGVCKMTLSRWLKDPELGFPKPVRIRKRYYFSEAAIVAWEVKQGKIDQPEPETVGGRPVVSGVIQNYGDFVKAMTARRKQLDMACLEVDLLSGMQEGYANKLENWKKGYGRGIGPETLPLWLGGLRVGIILVDLPRRPRKPRSHPQLDASAAA